MGPKKNRKHGRLFNQNSVSVEVISFDGLIKVVRRVLDIVVDQNPRLREIQSQREEIDEMEVGEIPF